MSEYRLQYCVGCDKRIEKRPNEAFNYTETADGPYCDFCWHFILRIEALCQRVSDLEAHIRLEQQRITE